MGRAMPSTSLIQFSVDKQGCVPSPLFDLGQNCGGGSENNDSLLRKVPCMPCSLSAPNPAAGLQGRFLDIHGQVWLILLWGLCSFRLGPVAQAFVCALQESVSPVLCMCCWLYGGVNAALLQEG